MNEINVDGVVIRYPGLAFIFNPVSVYITADTEGEFAVIARGKEIRRNTKGLVAVFDLSAIAKSLFDRHQFNIVKEKDDILIKNIQFEIRRFTGSEWVFVSGGDINLMWGALQIGETYTQSKTLTSFRSYPFTVPLYITSKINLEVITDTGETIDAGSFDPGKYNIDISEFSHYNSIGLYSRIDEKVRVFNYTFSSPFGPQLISRHEDLNIRIRFAACPRDGYYLRWINKHGEYNYYLFRHTFENAEVKDSDVGFDYSYTTTDFTNHYHTGTNKQIGKSVQRSVRLFASLIDSHDFDIVSDLPESPVVDMFAGYDNGIPLWIGVNIQPGTFSRGKEHLQDYEFNILLPKTQVQTI